MTHRIGLAACFAVAATQACAATTTYSDRAAFEAALTGGFTEISTDVSRAGQTTAQLSAATPGASFFGYPSAVRSDGLIPHGAGLTAGAAPFHVGLNFDTPVFGVGVTTNPQDGGDVMIYSGQNGTGTLLGEANFGDGGVLFGGITSSDLIGSVVFTCEFNFDRICGLIDPVFGTAAASTIPLPAPAALLPAALGLMVLRRRRRG